MRARKKLLASLAVLAVMSVAVLGTFAAFTATTTNAGNQIDSGTVKIDDGSGTTTALYNVTNYKPGESKTACLRIRYAGSLGAAVKLYASTGITNGADYTLKVERGAGLTTVDGTRSCAGFSATSSAYDATLGGFATTYAAGLDGKASGAAWAENDTVDYRFTITQNDDPTPNARTSVKSSGIHSFTWEARNS